MSGEMITRDRKMVQIIQRPTTLVTEYRKNMIICMGSVGLCKTNNDDLDFLS